MDTSEEYIAMCRQAVDYLPEHKWDTGCFYAGIIHVCTNEAFWKSTQEPQHEEGHWKKVMHARDNEMGWGVVDDLCDPNFKVNCGHYEYSEVWPLYRQDQLQSLYKVPITPEEELGSKQRTPHLIYAFYTFVFGEQFARAKDKAPAMEYSLKFKSMEQLWLAFIMQEEYGKLWNGKEWETTVNQNKRT